MAKHDTTGDGHKKSVDPTRITKPKDDGGKHSGGDKGGSGGKK
jgi:hypothetical protein